MSLSNQFFKIKTIFSVVMACMLFFLSCIKKPSAGFGGNSTLNLTAKHHGLVVDSVTFYIKFNSLEAPSDIGEYDYSAQTLNGMITVPELKNGEYYIFAKGWEPNIAKEVKGGIPYTISEEGTKDILVAVTETH